MRDTYYGELPLSPFPLLSQELGEQEEEEERNGSIILYGPEWYGAGKCWKITALVRIGVVGKENLEIISLWIGKKVEKFWSWKHNEENWFGGSWKSGK